MRSMFTMAERLTRTNFSGESHSSNERIVTCVTSSHLLARNSLLSTSNLVTRGTSSVPGDLGPVTLVIDPNFNLSRAIFEGLDYEAIYILDFVAASFVCHLKSYRGSAVCCYQWC